MCPLSHARHNVRNTLTTILFGLVLRYYSAGFLFNWHTELKCVKPCSCSDTPAVLFGRWFVLSRKLLEGDCNNALVFTAYILGNGTQSENKAFSNLPHHQRNAWLSLLHKCQRLSSARENVGGSSGLQQALPPLLIFYFVPCLF